MLEEQLDYLDGARNRQSIFYSREEEHPDVQPFKLKVKPSSDWLINQNESWYYVLNHPEKLPVQGWKIHLSANIEDAQDMLDTVTPYLIENKISFKFVPSKWALIEKNSKYGDRGASGKFITIYPKNEVWFAKLLPYLKEITSKFSLGPYILSDQAWQESNVYYRYGGFQSIYKEDEDGNQIACICTPDGELVEDKRLPYYVKPDFAKEPVILAQNTQPNPDTFKPLLLYKIEEALHFSNAGGVYYATKDGQPVVLKEGRLGAGLDAINQDGFTRVHKEAEVLRKLSDIPAVVDVYDEFTSWRHHYLAEEYIEGIPLEDILPTEFPFNTNEVVKKEKYVQKVKDILRQLKEAIEQIHEAGYALGDLSLGNVLVTADNKVRLIDFESAEKLDTRYTPGLTTPGFVSNSAKTFEEADWFALMRIAYHLFLPIIPVKDLAPEIVIKHEKWIGQYFGASIVEFLHGFRDKVPKQSDSDPIFIEKYFEVPKVDLNQETISTFSSGLTKGILNHLAWDKDELVPGNLSENLLDFYTFENGASGILWTLPENQALKKWSEAHFDSILNVARQTNTLGLFNGLSGIYNALKKQKIDKPVSLILNEIQKKLTLKTDDISLTTGLSGIALTLLKEGIDISSILQELSGRWDKRNQDNFEDEDIGLLTGWAGVSYLFWQAGERDKAKEILLYILTRHTEGDANIYITDNSRGFTRLVPYLENGIFGLALLLNKFRSEDEAFKKQTDDLFTRMIQTCFNYCTYMPGVISGYSGIFPIANALAKNGDAKLLDYSLACLNNYLVKNKDEVLLPGKYGYKISLDFENGNAGLLMMLNQIQNSLDDFSWLPI